LTVIALETTGVFDTGIHDWRVLKPEGDKTLGNFKIHFADENEERLRKLTAQGTGFHGAHLATEPTAPVVTPTTAQPSQATAIAANATGGIHLNNGVTMYYCWSHGLGKNRAHTSATCTNRRKGHKEAATADNLMAGNNTIYKYNPRRIAAAQV
jgi:hypothetical protein